MSVKRVKYCHWSAKQGHGDTQCDSWTPTSVRWHHLWEFEMRIKKWRLVSSFAMESYLELFWVGFGLGPGCQLKWQLVAMLRWHLWEGISGDTDSQPGHWPTSNKQRNTIVLQGIGVRGQGSHYWPAVDYQGFNSSQRQPASILKFF